MNQSEDGSDKPRSPGHIHNAKTFTHTPFHTHMPTHIMHPHVHPKQSKTKNGFLFLYFFNWIGLAAHAIQQLEWFIET